MALPRTLSRLLRAERITSSLSGRPLRDSTGPVSEKNLRVRRLVQRLRAELAHAKEKERRQLAERLHDGLGQDLALAKIKADRLKNLLPAHYNQLAAEISELLGRNIGDIRSFIRELSADWQSEVDFESALRSLAGYIETKYGLSCRVETSGPPPEVAGDVRDTLLQAIRELLVNAAKHAEASEAKVLVGRNAGNLLVEVVDNGRGLPKKITSSSGGFGLFSVRARLTRIGAEFRIGSRSRAGTQALITLSPQTRPREQDSSDSSAIQERR